MSVKTDKEIQLDSNVIVVNKNDLQRLLEIVKTYLCNSDCRSEEDHSCWACDIGSALAPFENQTGSITITFDEQPSVLSILKNWIDLTNKAKTTVEYEFTLEEINVINETYQISFNDIPLNIINLKRTPECRFDMTAVDEEGIMHYFNNFVIGEDLPVCEEINLDRTKPIEITHTLINCNIVSCDVFKDNITNNEK